MTKAPSWLDALEQQPAHDAEKNISIDAPTDTTTKLSSDSGSVCRAFVMVWQTPPGSAAVTMPEPLVTLVKHEAKGLCSSSAGAYVGAREQAWRDLSDIIRQEYKE